MPSNPFEVTKAVDFDDAQISETYVSFPGGGLLDFASPSVPMPRFLVGGKGGGRTHLLRYFSYPLQKLRHGPSLFDGLTADGYIGVYFRCGGLNAGRFAGKGQPDSAWQATFSYYMDVWLTHLLLDTLRDLNEQRGLPWEQQSVEAFAGSLLGCFDDPPEQATVADGDALIALGNTMTELQREMDRSINNAALRRSLEITIRSTPGRLVFGAAQAAVNHLPGLEGLRVVFLLDEYENLSDSQQQYVNTLVREKEAPTTFVIGSRRWGVRTMRTFSAGEENRQGSEYDEVVLEQAYAGSGNYVEFCRELVRLRLQQEGYGRFDDQQLARLFENQRGTDKFCNNLTIPLVRSFSPQERPYFVRLRRQLTEFGLPAESAPEATRLLALEDFPLLEKFAVMLLYRAWAKGDHRLLDDAREAGEQARAVASGGADKKLMQSWKHYRDDLLAQLYYDCRSPQPYTGLDRFVEMSGYLPRNLLVILKQVTRWAQFLGETPFVPGSPISSAAQREGVTEAASWFLADSKALGQIGEAAQGSIRRLGSLLRDMRFSDKPVEVSCATFSTSRQGLTPTALETLDACVQHSLLIEIREGLRDRNTHVLHRKYQLNPMLSPLFDLPTARRGVVQLAADELNAIFDPTVPEERYDSLANRRLTRMNVPFGQRRPMQGTLL